MPSTTARIVFELLKAQSKAPIFGIPYKGSATAITETIGGQVPLVDRHRHRRASARQRQAS